MFKILGHDQKEYGPVTADVLRQWIAERRANAQTMVQADGTGRFRPLGEFPEFHPALAAASAAAAPRWTVTTAPAPPPPSGLAVASLVLGILGFCLAIPSIPAVITGHMALRRIRREPDKRGGKGLAIAGLVMGYAGLVILGIAMILPALAAAKYNAQRAQCVKNMRELWISGRIYSNNHNDAWPQNFNALSNEVTNLKAFICPGDSDHLVAMNWDSFEELDHVSYEWVCPGEKESETLMKPVIRCPIHRTVLLGDGTVQRGRRAPRGF